MSVRTSASGRKSEKTQKGGRDITSQRTKRRREVLVPNKNREPFWMKSTDWEQSVMSSFLRQRRGLALNKGSGGGGSRSFERGRQAPLGNGSHGVWRTENTDSMNIS